MLLYRKKQSITEYSSLSRLNCFKTVLYVQNAHTGLCNPKGEIALVLFLYKTYSTRTLITYSTKPETWATNYRLLFGYFMKEKEDGLMDWSATVGA